MKKFVLYIMLFVSASSVGFCVNGESAGYSVVTPMGKITFKIKNDTDEAVRVVTGKGSHYSLTKGATTSLTLDEGDALYLEKNGGKGAKLIEATSSIEGKVFNLSKLL